MKTNSVQIHSCRSLQDFDMKRMFLESHGVTVLPDSESTVSAHPLYANAIGGIRIKVDRNDAERAQQLLREYENAASSETAQEYVCIKKTLLVALPIGFCAGTAVGFMHNSIAAALYVFILVSFFAFIPLTQVFRYKKHGSDDHLPSAREN